MRISPRELFNFCQDLRKTPSEPDARTTTTYIILGIAISALPELKKAIPWYSGIDSTVPQQNVKRLEIWRSLREAHTLLLQTQILTLP